MKKSERERLVLLAEEASETIQAVTKALRHGMTGEHPDSGITNREQLESEIGDLTTCIAFLLASGDIRTEEVRKRVRYKISQLRFYTYHQKRETLDVIEEAVKALFV